MVAGRSASFPRARALTDAGSKRSKERNNAISLDVKLDIFLASLWRAEKGKERARGGKLFSLGADRRDDLDLRW